MRNTRAMCQEAPPIASDAMMGTVRIIQALQPQHLARDAAIGALIIPFRAAVLFPTQRAPRSRSNKPHSLYPADRSDGPSGSSNTNSCVGTVDIINEFRVKSQCVIVVVRKQFKLQIHKNAPRVLG